jgi:hypothetical protein
VAPQHRTARAYSLCWHSLSLIIVPLSPLVLLMPRVSPLPRALHSLARKQSTFFPFRNPRPPAAVASHSLHLPSR